MSHKVRNENMLYKLFFILHNNIISDMLFFFVVARFQVLTVYKMITFFWNGKMGKHNMAEIHQHFEYKCLQLTYITLTGRRCIL